MKLPHRYPGREQHLHPNVFDPTRVYLHSGKNSGMSHEEAAELLGLGEERIQESIQCGVILEREGKLYPTLFGTWLERVTWN